MLVSTSVSRFTTRLQALRLALVWGLLIAAAVGARADVAVLVEEPFHKWDTNGHVAIYLSRVCAESPVVLRRCRPGELGVVIARYHRVSLYDWLAMPLIPYLYAVDAPESAPDWIDSKTEAQLRDRWRRQHLRAIVPDRIGPDGQPTMPGGNWIQLAGTAYDRKVIGFRFATTEAQDDAFIAAYNARPNRSRFNIVLHNCADFAAGILDFYFPKAVRRNRIADLGVMTPKQVALRMVRYARLHPELHMTTFIIPQTPGSNRRSRPAYGLAEGLVKTWKYAIPLTIAAPPVTCGLLVLWLCGGRFALPRSAPPMPELSGHRFASPRPHCIGAPRNLRAGHVNTPASATPYNPDHELFAAQLRRSRDAGGFARRPIARH